MDRIRLVNYILEKKLVVCSWAWIVDLYFDAVCSDRTFMGELVYRSKYQAEASALDRLVTTMKHAALQLQKFPLNDLGSVTCVAHVPSNPPKVPFSVSSALASGVANGLGIEDISCELAKKAGVPAAKHGATPSSDWFIVTGPLDGERVLVVDDVFRTGATIDAVAGALTTAGAAQVVGLCAAKANKGMVAGAN